MDRRFEFGNATNGWSMDTTGVTNAPTGYNFSMPTEPSGAPEMRRSFDSETNPAAGKTAPDAQTEDTHTLVEGWLDADGKEFDPDVGWLVCTQGSDKGTTFSLKDGYNYIGRQYVDASQTQTCGIRLSDKHISHTVACAQILYDNQSREFLITRYPGGKTMCRVNNEVQEFEKRKLNRMDRINFGGMVELMFVPLCGPEFDWERKE